MSVMMGGKTVSQILLGLSLCLVGGCLGGESIHTTQDTPIEHSDYFEKGWDAFMLGQYSEALDIWEQELARRDKQDPVPLAMVHHMATTYAVWGQQLKTEGDAKGAHRAFQRQDDLLLLRRNGGDPSALHQDVGSYLSGKGLPNSHEEDQPYQPVREKSDAPLQNEHTQRLDQGHEPALVFGGEIETQNSKGQQPYIVDGPTCLRDLVQIRLREMTPWQVGELQLEMQQGAAVRNLTNFYVMVNLRIHYSGAYTSEGFTSSPRYPVEVDKRPSLLLDPRAQATEWHFPVKDVYVWAPHSQWDLTPKINVVASTCYLYKIPPAHWDADSHKRLKENAAQTKSFDP